MILFSGDFRQILLIISRSTVANERVALERIDFVSAEFLQFCLNERRSKQRTSD